MLKTSLKIILALTLAFIAFLFWQASLSENVRPEVLPNTAKPKADVLTVAFGSCNRQDKPQDYWPVIGSHKPDVWLWLGDNIYADRMGFDQYDEEFARQKNNPYYGLNDGGKEFEQKATAKTRLLEFLDVPKDAAVRTYEGSYQSYLVGEGDQSLKIILLDSRYFRDGFAKATEEGHRYGKNPTGDILGEKQWAWLETELTNSPAAAHLIASSMSSKINK